MSNIESASADQNPQEENNSGPAEQQSRSALTSRSDKPKQNLTIAETLRVLDVARQVRQERETAEQALQRGDLRREIKRKLAESAKITGDDITEEEIDAAIDQYFENLHAFKHPPWGIRTFLAHMYVLRRRVAAALFAAGAILCVIWFLFLSAWGPFNASAVARRAAEQRLEQAETIRDQIVVVSKAPTVTDDANRLFGELQAGETDADTAEKTLAKMKRLLERLNENFELHVLSGTDEESGFERSFTDENGTRSAGYYLVVEARDADGEPMTRKIRNSETGIEKEVARWAQRVPKAVFDRLVADKKEDGVLNETLFATKRLGELDSQIVLSGLEAASSTSAQLTEW